MPKRNKNTNRGKKSKKNGAKRDPMIVATVTQVPDRNKSKAMTGPVGGGAPRRRRAAHAPLAEAVCGISNPFCDQAIGARYADASASRSLPYVVRFSGTVVTGTGGAGAAIFKAMPNGIYVASTSSAVDNQTMPATWTLAASLPTGWDEARLTSWGVRSSNILSTMTSSGLLKVITFTEPPAVSSVINVNAYTQANIESYPNAPGTTATWVAKPVNAVQSRRFLPIPAAASGDTGDAESPCWQTCGVFVQGGPASTGTTYYEVVAHYEFTLVSESALVPYARPMPPPTPVVTKAMELVVAKSPQTHWNKTSEAVDEWFAQASTYALNVAAGAAMKYGPEMLMGLLA